MTYRWRALSGSGNGRLCLAPQPVQRLRRRRCRGVGFLLTLRVGGVDPRLMNLLR